MPDRAAKSGMSDELTERVANAFTNTGTPMVLKYVPYGKLSGKRLGG